MSQDREPAESAAIVDAPDERATAVGREVSQEADAVWTPGDRNGTPAVRRHERRELRGPRGRVAIIDGCRTPFVKSGAQYAEMDVIDLASVPAAALVARLALDPAEVDEAIFGVVIPSLKGPNLGREVILRTPLPDSIPGSTVNLACASSNRAITDATEAILLGYSDVVLAGGAESLSTVPITFTRNAAQLFMEASKARSVPAKVSTLAKIRPGDLVPQAPAIAEYTTGLTMGQSAEKMAKENAVSRRAQDEIALLSHRRAARAHAEGRFAGQVVPTYPEPSYGEPVTKDTIVRDDTDLDALGKLKPVFDKGYGTLTAGNSSPLTDGASAVVLMSEEKAKALGYEPLGYVRSFAYAALDPATQLLQGPAYAAPVALDRAGVTLGDIDLVEMHEAFAAQVLSNMKALASRKFAREELGRDEPVGEIDLDRFNVNGGSIALGHPFGATGARITTQLLYELKRRGQGLGLITVCAAGGHGFSMVVERE